MSNDDTALSGPECSALREWIDLDGMVNVAASVGASRESVARATAGIGVRRGTVVQIRVALAARRGGHTQEACPNGADHDWICATPDERIRLRATEDREEFAESYARAAREEEEEP